jgi:hypothetical protein
MPIDKSDVFTKSFIFRKVQRKIKEKLAGVAASFPVEDLSYAVRSNKDIVGWYLSRMGMTQHQRRKRLAPWKDLLQVITADDLLALVNEVSPAHAQILAANRNWFDAQVQKLRDDLAL